MLNKSLNNKQGIQPLSTTEQTLVNGGSELRDLDYIPLPAPIVPILIPPFVLPDPVLS